MKVTFIEPYYFSTWECLGIGYLGSYLKRHFKGDLELNFFQGFFDSDETIVKGCVDSDIVGFSCTSPTFKHGLKLAKQIKMLNPKSWTVFGGWHPSALPVETLQNPEVDQVVIGEGEESMLKICGGSWDKILWCRPIEKLDELPFPDRELIKNERTIALTERNDGERIASVQASRGCPFRCIMCGEYLISENNIRDRSPDNVLDEIEQIIDQYKISFLKFRDATWNTSIEKVETFCKRKIQRGINIPWGANWHPAISNRYIFRLMKVAQCREIWVGCESGSQRILKEIRKGTTVQQIERVFKWSKQAGLQRRAYFILGSPSEDTTDIASTFRLAEKIDADVYGFTLCAHYPGTQLYDPKENVDWSAVDEYSNDVWGTRYLTNEDLKYYQKRLVKKFKDKICFRQQEDGNETRVS